MQMDNQEIKSKNPEILDPTKILVDVEFVAALLGDVVGTVYNKAPVGLLPFPCYKVGRSLRFKYSEIMAWVKNLQPAPILRTKKPKVTVPKKSTTSRRRGRPIGTTKVALKKLKSSQVGAQS